MTTDATTTLTDRQERFIHEYMADQNASAAARRCGYSGRSAASYGSALMQIPAIRERIRMEMRQMLADLKLHAMDLMRERMRAAFFRSGKMFGPDGRLLQVQEMENEMRELLDISVEMRGDMPILRLKQPSREKALAALEKVHDRLDRLDEKYYDQLAREQAAERMPESVSGPVPPRPEIFRDLTCDQKECARPSTSSGRTEEGGGAAAQPHDLSRPGGMPASEKPHGFSRSGEMPASEKHHDLSGPAAKPGAEKAHHLSSSGEKPAPEKPHGLSGSAEPEEEPYDFRKDPNAAWGGRRKQKPVEPGLALQEHLLRVKQDEHNAELRAALAKLGRIKPGEPTTLQPPGFNPWARDNRPQYAIGHDEFHWSE